MVTLLEGVSLDGLWYSFVRNCGLLDNVCIFVKYRSYEGNVVFC